MTRVSIEAILTALAVMSFAAASTWAQDELKMESTEHYNLKKGLALDGYDPVSYFTDGKPLKGERSITSTHNGVTYRFATQDHKAKFDAEPETYLPEYGGWCATAMAEGKKVKIDPENYKITGGRLFLFYKGFIANAKTDWDKDETALTKHADENWQKLNKT